MRLAAAVTGLEPRQFAAIAHDSVDSQFLLFGGTYGSERFDDTWLLTSSGWQVEKTKAYPAARISSAAAYDSVRHEYVLFGGRVREAKTAPCENGFVPVQLVSEYFCGDTWVFTKGKWVERQPAASPPAREGHAMVFDATRGEVVLFGGIDASGTQLIDTWLWNGSTWKLATPAHNPPPRFWPSMAYDPVHREVVLFGGDSGTKFLNDTWMWNGKDWKQAGRQVKPPAVRTSAGMDYDPTTGKIVLFSGSTWNARGLGTPAVDAWSWNGTQWNKLPSTKFKLITSFSKLTSADLSNAILANGTPSILWQPEQ